MTESLIPEGAHCGCCRFFDHTKHDQFGRPSQLHGRCRVRTMTSRSADQPRNIVDACWMWERGQKVKIRVPAPSPQRLSLPAPGTAQES